MTQRYVVRRWLRNHREPDNVIAMIGILDPDDSDYLIRQECAMFGRFADGPTSCGVIMKGEGQFEWWNDDLRGVEATFAEAWEHLPALVTEPDDFEDEDAEPFKEPDDR